MLKSEQVPTQTVDVKPDPAALTGVENGHPVAAPVYDFDSPEAIAERKRKNAEALRLLHEWLADESGYDEEMWPILKKALEEDRTSYGSFFSDEPYCA